MADTYRIERFYHEPGKMRRVMKRRLTLDEAKAHCRDPKSRKEGIVTDEKTGEKRILALYFDGFTKE